MVQSRCCNCSCSRRRFATAVKASWYDSSTSLALASIGAGPQPGAPTGIQLFLQFGDGPLTARSVGAKDRPATVASAIDAGLTGSDPLFIVAVHIAHQRVHHRLSAGLRPRRFACSKSQAVIAAQIPLQKVAATQADPVRAFAVLAGGDDDQLTLAAGSARKASVK